jgi:hypothetical protein
VLGGAKVAYDIAAANPKTTALAADLAAAALPQTNLPVLKQAQQIAKAPFTIARGALDAADAYTASNNAKALAQVEHQIRMYGGNAPQELQRAAEALRSRVAGPIPTAPTPAVPTGPIATGPVAPAATPTAPIAQAAENVAARAPSMLDKTTAMIRQLAANKVVQTLGKGMTGLQLATYSQELGPQTPQVGRMKGMEINPITGRPWTQQQLAQYSANPQIFDSQLPPAQMPR